MFMRFAILLASFQSSFVTADALAMSHGVEEGDSALPLDTGGATPTTVWPPTSWVEGCVVPTGCEDPNDADEDGVLDCDELQFGTNPDLNDTDGDSLIDGVEIYASGGIPAPASVCDSYGNPSNPLSSDTDGDGFSDWHEFEHGYDPTTP